MRCFVFHPQIPPYTNQFLKTVLWGFKLFQYPTSLHWEWLRRNQNNKDFWWGFGKRWTLLLCRWEHKLCSQMEWIWRFLKTLKVDPCDPDVPLWGTYRKGRKSTCHRNTWTSAIIAFLLEMQPRENCWLWKMCCTHTEQDFVHSQRKRWNHDFLRKQIHLEIVISEISQTKKEKYWTLSLIHGT